MADTWRMRSISLCQFRSVGYFGLSIILLIKKNPNIIAYETLPQGYFLEAMGIVHRVDLLKEKADEDTQRRLDSE